MAAHTPGPFSAKGKYVFAGRDCIAICYTGNAPEERMEANARLFAAAPDYAAASSLAIAALSFALEQAIRENDFVAILQYSAAKDALIAADNKRTGRGQTVMKDVTPTRAALAKAEGK